MPWPRVAASRPETPRPPHGAAAGVTHAQHLTGACPCLSASFIPPGGWAARDPVRCRGGLGMRLRRYPSRRVADRLRMREACDSERGGMATPSLLPRPHGIRDQRWSSLGCRVSRRSPRPRLMGGPAGGHTPVAEVFRQGRASNLAEARSISSPFSRSSPAKRRASPCLLVSMPPMLTFDKPLDIERNLSAQLCPCMTFRAVTGSFIPACRRA